MYIYADIYDLERGRESHTFREILMMPVRTETLENSTALKISMRSEKSFCMLLIKLLSMVL